MISRTLIGNSIWRGFLVAFDVILISVDLRFIPDEIDFEEDQIRVQRTTEKKDICNEKPINYTPPDFVSSALTRTKCDLTWDETDKRRTNLLRKSDLVEDQVQHLIASGSEAGFHSSFLSIRAF